MSGKHDIDSLLDDVVTLPSLPDTVARVTSMVDDPDCRLSDVATAISGDPALAIKTLRLVNSAYYGLGQQVTTIEHAVVMLGIKVIKNLALTATVFEAFQTTTMQFLRHSITCAMAMRTFAEGGTAAVSRLATGDEGFVFGLVHDVGKVILEEYLPEEWAKVPVLVKKQQIPWYKAERAIIGVDHAEVGARLAEKWRLAPTLVSAVAGHHDLTRCHDADSRTLAASVAVADFLSAAAGVPAYTPPCFDLSDDVWTLVGMDAANLPAVADHFFKSYHTVDELAGLAS
ncbi:MAG: HDOD domain-containing protein [Candidatus Hydrogenedentota bacterium]